jgi:hypothetical protein
MVLGLACTPQVADPTGGETHFLRLCDPAENACGDLSCICGVCTRTCDGGTACTDLGGAQCLSIANETCEPTADAFICEVTCGGDSQCSGLSRSHRCVSGVCRANALGDSGSPSSGGSGGDEVCESAGTVAANEVLLMGDSFFATGHQITAYLEDRARTAGVLQVGERYRDQSRLTGNALAFAGEGLLAQYQEAASDAAARVVIMNGGGADVLLGSCDSVDETCPLLVDAALAFDALLALMADDGVTDVVYVAYPDPQVDTVKERMDALRPMLEEVCGASPVPCHWVDLRPVFEGNYADYILADGFNPTATGSEASAGAIWDALREQCIAQ